MSRALSSLAIQQFFAENIDIPLFVLFEISHPDWSVSQFFVNNTVAIISNGDTYEPYPINMIPPGQGTDEISKTTTLTIDCVDKTLLNILRSVSSPITVSISMVMESDPNTVIFGPFTSKMKSVPYDNRQINGILMTDDIMSAMFPKDTFNLGGYPNLWRN